MRGALDGSVLEHFETEGWAVLPSVLSSAEVARIRAELVGAARESEARGIPTRMDFLDPGGNNVRVYDLLEYSPVFLPLARREDVLGYVEVILLDHTSPPGDVVLSNFSANIALPGSRSMRAHCDQSTVMPPPWARAETMNAIWCLDHVCEEVGATRYLPGSHRITCFAEAPSDPTEGMRAFEAPAGSVILMDGRLWHTSGDNTTPDRERALLFAFYARSYLRLQNNWWRSLSRDTQRSLDPASRRLLGLDSGNIAYGTHLADWDTA